MTVREYIGARYVPLFADPLEWDSSKTYEPLTVVYYQGNSYTSRQAVPSGIDINNDQYWALTGNYNAQIEQYRTEVRTFDERITANSNNISSIGNDIVSIENEIDAVSKMHSATQGKVRYRIVDNIQGNDDTAGIVDSQTDTSAMYKTLQAAFDSAVNDGNDIRIYFNNTGNYSLQVQVIAGCVIHMLPNANCPAGTININLAPEQTSDRLGRIYIYDTHLNLTGTENTRIVVNTLDFIEAEGSTVWAWYVTFNMTKLYCIQGSADMRYCIFNCWLEMKFLSAIFYDCTFASKNANSNALYALSCNLRFQRVNTGNIFINNENGGAISAIGLYSTIIAANSGTIGIQGSKTDYNRFVTARACLMMLPAELLVAFDTYATNECQIDQYSIVNSQVAHMECGGTISTPVTSHSYADVTIDFPVAFRSAPYVNVTLSTSATGYQHAYVTAWVVSRTTTQCVIRIFNGADSDYTVNAIWQASR